MVVFGSKSSSPKTTKLFEQPLDKLICIPKEKRTEPINHRLSIDDLPQPIKCLLEELYLRGPETVGIFRKSPNAKHCKELRQKLETATTSTTTNFQQQQNQIEHFQVSVIASVLKEWLRSLPDCLLMSRLYPQWIDVAKLIEPIHLDKQRQLQQAEETKPQIISNTQDQRTGAQETTFSSYSPSPRCSTPKQSSEETSAGCQSSLRPASTELSRALSCTIMNTNSSSTSESDHDSANSPPAMMSMSSLACNKSNHSHTRTPPVLRYSRQRGCDSAAMASSRQRFRSEDLADTSASSLPVQRPERPPMTQRELFERHNECIRIVRQLLDLLHEPNSILLRAIVCVLRHIADRCGHNMMSSQNLGVCVGQSLLNDEHQLRKGSHSFSANLYSMRSSGNLCSSSPSNSTGGAAVAALKRFSNSTFAKRRRRARSQSMLASTLSLTNLSHLSSTPTPKDGTSSPHHTSSISSFNVAGQLESSGAQETAKYVPILVAFMIDNAEALFGSDIVSLFGNLKQRSVSTQQLNQDTSKHQLHLNIEDSSQASCKGETSSAISSSLAEASRQEDTNVENSSNQSDVRPVASVASEPVNPGEMSESAAKRKPTATERLCSNSSDLNSNRSSVNLINNSTAATTTTTTTTTTPPPQANKQHRRNLSTSVIVQIKGLTRGQASSQTSNSTGSGDNLVVSRAANGTGGNRASSPSSRLSEAGTTTSILIVNAPKATDLQLGNQSTSGCSSQSGNSSDDEELDECRRRCRRLRTAELSQSVSPSCGSQGSCSIDVTDNSNQQQQMQQLQQQQQQQQQPRPLSATESTGSSSRASSSTSGVHSDSLAFSSETDTRHPRGQPTTCPSSMSAAISIGSSPDPSSSIASSSVPSICASPSVDMVDGREPHHRANTDYRFDTTTKPTAATRRCQQRDRRVSESQLMSDVAGGDHSHSQTAADSGGMICKNNNNNKNKTTNLLDCQGRRQRLGGERPKSMACLKDDELLEFQTGGGNLTMNSHAAACEDKPRLESTNQFANRQPHLRSQDYVNLASQQQQQMAEVAAANRGVKYAAQRSCPMRSHTLNRYSSASSYQVTADRMPKIPFQYTTSCYGGEAVLYHPTNAHLLQQRSHEQQQQHQPLSMQPDYTRHPRACVRIQSLDRHPQQPWAGGQQLPQRSHVMMLRDYYLSLQEQSRQRQQALMRQPPHSQAVCNTSMNFISGVQQQPLNQRQQESFNVNRPPQQYTGPAPNEFAPKMQQGHCVKTMFDGGNHIYRQQPASAAIAQQRIQPRLARIRPNQFNGGLYVRRAPSPSHLMATSDVKANIISSTGSANSSGLIVRPLCKSEAYSSNNNNNNSSRMAVSQSSLSQRSSKMSSASSAEHSADDESDDCSTGEWMESTMV